jgi:murein DD-endopeptidase MepM/ murein hydrolase activator NlpD
VNAAILYVARQWGRGCALIRRLPSPVGKLPMAALLALGLTTGFLVGNVPQPTLAAAAATVPPAPAAKPAPIGIDLDGDGQLDLAQPVDHAMRGVDAYGSGAFGASRDGGSRAHRGIDLVATPGEPVRAPISGVITRIGAAYAGQERLTYVEIVNPDTHYTARLLYVGPTVEAGAAVAAGDVVGSAQDLAQRYPHGITNHVHVEFDGRRGARLDPAVVLAGLIKPPGAVA